MEETYILVKEDDKVLQYIKKLYGLNTKYFDIRDSGTTIRAIIPVSEHGEQCYLIDPQVYDHIKSNYKIEDLDNNSNNSN